LAKVMIIICEFPWWLRNSKCLWGYWSKLWPSTGLWL